MRRWITYGAALALVLTVFGGWWLAGKQRRPRTELDFDSVQIEIVPVRDDVFVLFGVGANVSAGNITLLLRDGGVLAVDSQYHQLGQKNLEAVRSLTDAPIRFVVNTHLHVDHVSGNQMFFWNGNIPADDGISLRNTEPGSSVTIIAHENTFERMSTPDPPRFRPAVWPNQTYEGDSFEVFFEGEPVTLLHFPAAHTDGDTVVHFVRFKVLSTGDIFHSTRYPYINRANGGSIQGELEALDGLARIVAPDGVVDDEYRVVPGHGPVATARDLLRYRDMVATVLDRVRSMVDAGMSLEQVQAASPTGDFDAEYDRSSGFWTHREFVESVYENLVAE